MYLQSIFSLASVWTVVTMMHAGFVKYLANLLNYNVVRTAIVATIRKTNSYFIFPLTHSMPDSHFNPAYIQYIVTGYTWYVPALGAV